jgi:class 3 adenylate cyclase/tetratricopeptide (TPR) repeat protein
MTTQSVAVLFTDLVSSTELSQRLSPDAADEVRRGHFSILRQAVTATGGTEVKNLGDGLMVVFSSASASLSCAVAMQQGVERDNGGRDLCVGLRVGLSGGEVTKEDDDYFGDPVVEAARLCAACEGGQILAADVVRAIAGRRSPHQVNALGTLALKGLPEPVETVEVAWVPLPGPTDVAVPLPARLAVQPSVGVVGRETESGLIAGAVKRVANGEGREVLLISGEAGVGKTTLAAEAARAAAGEGACVLFGHCEEDLSNPYQLFSEALGHYVTHAEEDRLVAHVRAHGSELARLVPALGGRLVGLPPSTATDSDSERYLLFSAVVGLLDLASRHQPVVLVFDDLQWADKGSLLLLRHLATAELPIRVLVLGTFRDSELSYSHTLLDTLSALHRQNGVTSIGLSGLDDTGVLSLMEVAAGHALDESGVGLAQAVYRETDGNPFFVTEVLRHLSETGAIYRDGSGRWVAVSSLENIALPESVRVVIGSRVARLGQQAGRVLSLAAVIGRSFDLEVLARSTGSTEDELLDVLDQAAAAALVREEAEAPGHFRFAHALIQRTLYEDMGPTRQTRAHRQVAEALEAVFGDRPGTRVGELAHHWFRATEPTDLTKAIDFSRHAADAALDALAPGDALRYYTQALDLSARAHDLDPTVAIDLAIGLGTAQRQTGDAAYSNTLLKAARQAAELGDTERLVAAALADDRGFFGVAGSIDSDKVEMLEQALSRLPENHRDRALLLAHLCSELIYGSSLEHRLALADEAIAIAQSTGDDATIVRVLDHVSRPLHVPQLLDQSLRRSADALVRAHRTGDPVLLLGAVRRRAYCAACAGDIDELDRCLEIGGSLTARLDQPNLNFVHRIERATRAMIAGDTDQAEQLAGDAFRIANEIDEPEGAITFGAQLGIVYWQRGRLEEIVPLMEQAIDENPGIPAFTAALTAALAEVGRTDDALVLLAERAATGFDLPLDHNWLTGMVLYAEAAIQCRDPVHSQSLFDRLAPWAGQMSGNVGTTEGPVNHYLGGLAAVLGRYDEADGFYADAARFSHRIGAKFFAANTDLSWGRTLLERGAPGDEARARDLVGGALVGARAQGYGSVERRAVTTLGGLD